MKVVIVVLLLAILGVLIHNNPELFETVKNQTKRVVKIIDGLPEPEEVLEVRKVNIYTLLLSVDEIPITEIIQANLKKLWNEAQRRLNPIEKIQDTLGLTSQELDKSYELMEVRVTGKQFRELNKGKVLTWGVTGGFESWTPYVRWRGVWVKEKKRNEVCLWQDTQEAFHVIQCSKADRLLEKIGNTYEHKDENLGLVRSFQEEFEPEPFLEAAQLELDIYFEDPANIKPTTLVGYEIISKETNDQLARYRVGLEVIKYAEEDTLQVGRVGPTRASNPNAVVIKDSPRSGVDVWVKLKSPDPLKYKKF